MDKHADASVFWVHASSVARLYESFHDIADAAELAGRDDASTDVLRLVHRWLTNARSGGRWCLMLDNIDDASLLDSPLLSRSKEAEPHHGAPLPTSREARTVRSCIPRCAHGAVLVTSRFRDAAHGAVGDYACLFQVDRMSEADGVRLLQSKLSPAAARSGSSSRAGGNSGASDAATAAAAAAAAAALDAIDVVRELGGVPLAITQAAAYISRLAPRMTLQRYVREFRRSDANRVTLLDQSAADLRHDANVPNAVVTSWALSFQQLVEYHAAAADLLALMSVLDNQSVPVFLVRPEGGDALLSFEERLGALTGFAMVALVSQAKALLMHPLVQLAMRRWLACNGELAHWQQEALRLLSQRYPLFMFKHAGVCRLLLPHAEIVTAFDAENDEARLQQAKILFRVAGYMIRAGFYSPAEEKLTKATTIKGAILGPGHPETIKSMSQTAVAMNMQGNFDGAAAMHQQVADRREKALGPDHPDTLRSLNRVAQNLMNEGQYAAAEELSRRVLVKFKNVLGTHHQDTLSCSATLAGMLERRGKNGAAEAMLQRVVRGFRCGLGPNHPDTLKHVSSLAGVLVKRGKFEAAEAMHRRAIGDCEKVLGPNHPGTLRLQSGLALALAFQSKFLLAEELLRRIIDSEEKVLGKEHPSTLISVGTLSRLLKEQGFYDAAEVENIRALDGFTKLYGDKHRLTLSALITRANVHQARGEYVAAEELNQLALERQRTALGHNNRETLASMAQLASVLEDTGRYDAAEALNRQALDGLRRVLGDSHPKTLLTMSYLASVLRCRGEYAAAEDMLRQALDQLTTVLGAENTDTLYSADKLGLVLLDKGNYDAAEDIIGQAVTGREKMLGADHPDTLTSVYNLASLRRARGRYDSAEKLHRRVLDGRRRNLGGQHPHVHQSMHRWRKRCISLEIMTKQNSLSGNSKHPIRSDALTTIKQ